MCPASLTTAALVVAGAASAGGLTALAARRLSAARGARVVVTFKSRGKTMQRIAAEESLRTSQTK